MTACIRRGPRRRKSDDLSNRLAALWRNRSTNVRTVALDLLGQGRFREMVVVALFLVAEIRKASGGEAAIPDREENEINSQLKVYIIFLIRR